MAFDNDGGSVVHTWKLTNPDFSTSLLLTCSPTRAGDPLQCTNAKRKQFRAQDSGEFAGSQLYFVNPSTAGFGTGSSVVELIVEAA